MSKPCRFQLVGLRGRECGFDGFDEVRDVGSVRVIRLSYSVLNSSIPHESRIMDQLTLLRN